MASSVHGLSFATFQSLETGSQLAGNDVAHYADLMRDKGWVIQIPKMIPPDGLSREQRVSLVAASLQKFGTKDLAYMSREYQLSAREQKMSIELAGEAIQNNISMTFPIDNGHHLEELKILAEKAGVFGEYQEFFNKVGNYKPVLIVHRQDGTYVVRQSNHQYVEEYQRRQAREHRPDILAFPIPGEQEGVILLSQFKGTQTIDYTNPDHLELIVELANTFSSDGSIIDFNEGNLIVDQNALFYIDKDLTYAVYENPRLKNFEYIMDNIHSNVYTTDEIQVAKDYVRHLIRDKLDLNQPEDQEIYQKLFKISIIKEQILAIDPRSPHCMENMMSVFPMIDRLSQREREEVQPVLHLLQMKLDEVSRHMST